MKYQSAKNEIIELFISHKYYEEERIDFVLLELTLKLLDPFEKFLHL